ncbi:Rubrerythrin [Paraliobacillus sp. PM-2]|uniref:ferritin family protein n=1 Tax=Paraliobacillus sp. PM-2 TaxID=1462524 RepID=UPI00061C3AF7|nr:ferritin family protein [Paraliobacillus sp. PM-2]CQR45963.1 Rubrerythrin [Paraliobacillus sp. PM-2]
MYTDPQDKQRLSDFNLQKNIQKAIDGEYNAIICYETLANLSPLQDDRKRILDIRKDEKRHLNSFSTIYKDLTGKQPTYELKGDCQNTFKEGIIAAFEDEQETVDFYLDIADQTEDTAIKQTFQRAAADEQNHAVWFLSFLNNSYHFDENRQINNYGAKAALDAPSLSIADMLTYALQDEYLAQARYDTILANFGNVRTFTQIKAAELRHIDALLPLFDRYQIQLPIDQSMNFVTTPETIKEAYASGVQGEIDNISMYDKFLTLNLPSDLQIVFTQLRNASINHLAAFERGLAR